LPVKCPNCNSPIEPIRVKRGEYISQKCPKCGAEILLVYDYEGRRIKKR